MRGYCIILTATALGACAQGRSDPASPESSVSNAPLSASSWGPETPPFNNEIILRDVTGNGGFGHVKFRQPNLSAAAGNRRERERRLHRYELAHAGQGRSCTIDHNRLAWHRPGGVISQSRYDRDRIDIRHPFSLHRSVEPRSGVRERMLSVRGNTVRMSDEKQRRGTARCPSLLSTPPLRGTS